MSDEQKETGKEPVTKSPESTPPAAAKPTPPAAAKVDETPSVEPGPLGKALEKAKIPVTHLGRDAHGNEMMSFEPAHLLSAATFLRDTHHFDLLLSCSGVDWKDRLESVYHVYSTQTHQYVVLKVTAENEHSPSLVPVWPAADWHERESYDLLGIQYDGHPNLVRILMPDDWLGHPLRKDYKLDDPRLVWNER